jgi:putative heme-binding domain-containing protein
MRQVDAQAVTIGDAQRGQRLFEGTGNCLSCHRVSGRGSRVGPELTEIGAVRTASSLQRSLIDPTAAMVPSNRSVRAVTRNGQVITGRRLNEDSYTLQLIDDHERLVSLAKADLRQFTVLTTSPMPSYKDARAQDIADVLAYLLSLKGSK